MNLVTHPTWMPGAARARELGFLSVLVVPLSARNQVSGVACFYSRRRLVFDSAFLRGLEGTGRHLGELCLRTALEKALEAASGRV